ncbi:5697_t:CDS:2, partial [Racocetra fulgida]
MIELQVSQFLYGVIPQKGGNYLRTSLKNALLAINHHLQDVKPVPENTSHAISGHKSSGGYYAYAKPTDNYKRETLANVLNKIITILFPSSTKAFQDLINDSDSEADNYEDLQNNIFEDDNDTSVQ